MFKKNSRYFNVQSCLRCTLYEHAVVSQRFVSQEIYRIFNFNYINDKCTFSLNTDRLMRKTYTRKKVEKKTPKYFNHNFNDKIHYKYFMFYLLLVQKVLPQSGSRPMPISKPKQSSYRDVNWMSSKQNKVSSERCDENLINVGKIDCLPNKTEILCKALPPSAVCVVRKTKFT